MSEQRYAILAAMTDAETKAWEGLSGYKFWMFGYHAARWVNYNQLLPQSQRFRNPFKSLVDMGSRKVDEAQEQLPAFEVQASLPLLGNEGDGA